MNVKPLGPRDVASATGVSTDTLRHYERCGLLPQVTRTAAGYRRYSPKAVDRVLLIQRALVVGFSLAELKRVLVVRDKGGAPCRTVRALVAQRLDELNRRIEQLVMLREDLSVLLDDWDDRLAKIAAGQRAHLLDGLGSRAGIERTRMDRRAHARTNPVRS